MENSNKIYYKIGEVCSITELKPSVLRFWEKQFKQLRPVKVGSKHRYYTGKHIDVIRKIKCMLYEEKLTIEGAKIKLNGTANEIKTEILDDIKKKLCEILSILNKNRSRL
jgi:DNA-binding transcriptional MerR regulator